MAFVSLALSKDTTHLYTAGCRETMWRKRLCLRKRLPSDQNQVALTTPQLEQPPALFTYSVGCLPKKSGTENRQNIVAVNLCQFFTYTWTRKGKTGLKQNNTNSKHLLRSLVQYFYMISRPSTIKTCLLVFYPLYKGM